MVDSIGVADIILLICFIPAVIGGIKKGFIRQLAGVIALILGIWAGYHFSDFFIEKVNIWSDTNATLVKILAFAIIFAAVLLIVHLIGQVTEGLVKMALLGWLDKVMGVLFAIIKTAIILSIVIYLLKSLDDLWNFLPHKELSESWIYSTLERLTSWFFPYLKEFKHITINI